MKATALILATLLSGCAVTASDVRQGTTPLEFSSLKPHKEVALCIADGWEAYRQTDMRETRNGYSVSLRFSDIHTIAVADIIKQGDGSKTLYYGQDLQGAGMLRYTGVVRTCQ